MTSRTELDLCVPADHPTLPGHFPGSPVVPGVVLLDRVIGATETWLGADVRVLGLPQVKFLSPLLPDETARAVLELQNFTVRFRIEYGDRLIAQGLFALSRETVL